MQTFNSSFYLITNLILCSLLANITYASISVDDGPGDYQVLQRDENNICQVTFSVSVSGESGFQLDIYKREANTSSYVYVESNEFNELGNYSFYYNINAGLVDWNFVIKSGSEVLFEASEVVCGDIYLIDGQSNAVAKLQDPAFDNTYANPFARALGYSLDFHEGSSKLPNTAGWGPASSRYDVNNVPSYFSGGWGLKLQHDIIETYEIPVGVINAGLGGSLISQHLQNASSFTNKQNHPGEFDNPLNQNLFEYLVSKLDRSKAKTKIKYIFWFQGESDQHLEDVNCGTTYTDAFYNLKQSWENELPSLENVFLFQIGLTAQCCDDKALFIREAQRQIARSHQSITLIPTTGNLETQVDPYYPEHYSPLGMESLVDRFFRIIEEKIYSPSKYIDKQVYAPDIQNIYYDQSANSLVLNFDHEIDVDSYDGNPSYNQKIHESFFDETVTTKLDFKSHTVAGNKLYLEFTSSNPSIPQKLVYLPSHYHNPILAKELYFGPWLKSANGPIYVPSFAHEVIRPGSKDNNWEKEWTNYGDGSINRLVVANDNKFLIGDFNGDNEEELLVIGDNDWVTLLKYNGTNWEWLWSTLDNSHHNITDFKNATICVGDFDGNGTDEIFCSDNNQAKMFGFNGTAFTNIWSNGPSHTIITFSDNMKAGDLNGDGKSDLLGADLPYGHMALYYFTNNDFIQVWKTTTLNPSGDIANGSWLLDYRDNFHLARYSGASNDEVLGFGNWATFFSYNGSWQWLWSTNGASQIAGWTYPLLSSDVILTGNLDNDNQEELFILENSTSADKANSQDIYYDNPTNTWYWSQNYSANSANVPFIGDWELGEGSGSDTRYFLIAPISGDPDYLLAMRNFSCTIDIPNPEQYLINMYRPVPTQNKSSDSRYTNNSNDLTTEQSIIQVFPNPNAGTVYLSSTNPAVQEISIQIYDNMGRMVYENRSLGLNESIDLSHLNSGMYFINSSHTIGVEQFKLIINKN